MNYFLDTEFIERGAGEPIDLISIGIVAEDGREFYAVSNEFNPDDASEWVKENVIAKLGDEPRQTVAEITHGILAFVGNEKPEFWGYYADYDWVVLCQLFGAMIDLPDGWPMFCYDIKQLAVMLGNPPLPQQGKGEHNAVADARWNKVAYDFLAQRKRQLYSGTYLIAEERTRQILVEGWTAEHDDIHTDCQLLDAAICYGGLAGSQMLDKDKGSEAKAALLGGWPWASEWWKPSEDPIRNLVKAGALIAAEIDRLQRKAEKESTVSKCMDCGVEIPKGHTICNDCIPF